MTSDNHQRGFTFIELVVAILIFAVGVTGMVGMQIEAVKSGAYSMQMAQAMNYTMNEAERWTAAPLSEVEKLPGDKLSDDAIVQSTEIDPQFQVRRWGGNEGGNGSYQINISTIWPVKQTEKTVSGTTTVGKDGETDKVRPHEIVYTVCRVKD